MAISEEELDQKRQRVNKLRDQLAQEEAKRTSHENDLANEVAGAQLDAEATRLEAQLAEAKRTSRVGEVKSGASTVLDAIKEEQSRADSQVKASEVNAQRALDAKEQVKLNKAAGEAATVAEQEALDKAAEANAKASAANATNVPEDMARSTVPGVNEKSKEA